MIRRNYLEWGRGPERTQRAAKELAPLFALRESLWKATADMTPFGMDYLALHSTLDHINRLADHFGVALHPVPHPSGDGAHFTRSGGR